ncbi:MAG TPA: helix-turn-helix domain-containing protein [Verrucomicrobiae bacterium]|nr:helix-turn-helix domain-containing protein [Verrucomicrobiae bacterium]
MLLNNIGFVWQKQGLYETPPRRRGPIGPPLLSISHVVPGPISKNIHNHAPLYPDPIASSTPNLHCDTPKSRHSGAGVPACVRTDSSGAEQGQFARMIGVSVTTLQNWEQGRRHPRAVLEALHDFGPA